MKSDLEKFQEFFKNYGISFQKSKFRRYYGGNEAYDGGMEFSMDGENVDMDSIEGSVWFFDKDGKFMGIVEGS